MLRAVSLRAMAAVLKPSFCRRSSPGCGHSEGSAPSHAQGTWKTVPMLTRTARRQRGSQQEGVVNTASTPSAAADRKIAPRLVESTIPSSTAIRRAPAQSCSAWGRRGRRMAHRTPRVS